jgi:hypothetical protein
VRSSALYGPLLAFCRRAAELLEREAEKGGLPRVAERRIERRTEDSSTPVEQQVVDWGGAMQLHGSAIEALPEYGAAVEALSADANAARHLDALVGAAGTWQTRLDARGCLRGLLALALQDAGLPLADEQFDAAFDQLDTFFRNEKIAFDCVAPLEGLTIEEDRIELGPGHWIAKLSLEQRAELQTEALRLPLQGRTGNEASAFVAYMTSPKWITSLKALRTTEEPPPSLNDDHRFVFQLMTRQLLIALRLFKPGNVALRYARISPRFWNPVAGLHRDVWSSSVRGIRVDSYVLSAAEGQAFAKFHDDLRRKVWSKGALGVAIRRFCTAAERPLGDSSDHLEEQLIDLLIALEALLVPEKGTELSYRLATRGAALLGKNREDRIATFNLLRAAYDERSNIVHGSPAGGEVKIRGEGQVSAWELARRTTEATRAVIKLFVDRLGQQSQRELLDLADDRVVGGLGYPDDG